MHLRGLGATRNLDRAETLLQTACSHGIADACADLGEVYIERRDADARAAQAFELFRRACERSSARGCARLGRSLVHAVGVPPDPERALTLLKTTCHRGEPEACIVVGGFYLGSTGARPEPKEALRFVERAVAHGGGHGALALMYWKGIAVERNLDEARVLFSTGCDHGDAAACVNLGIMCQLGEGGATDHAAAVAAFGRACAFGSERGCAATRGDTPENR
jgi:hypothetical protein